MTAVIGRPSIRTMVDAVRARHRALEVETNSGSRYVLIPAGGACWNVIRFGVDGQVSYHKDEMACIRDNDLRIGPWMTTGLRDLRIL